MAPSPIIDLWKVSYDIHLRAISQEVLMNLISKICLEITLFKTTAISPRRQSVNNGRGDKKIMIKLFFRYEKMISGMYMGEIARQAIVQCIKAGLLLNGEVTEEMDTPLRFYTKYISEIEKWVIFPWGLFPL